jgi:hypothetical protein
MRLIGLVVGLATAAAAFVGCSDGAATPKVPRAVDVSALTFADVQQRTRAAATKPGVIFHSTDVQHSDSYGDAVSETWLDLERRIARLEQNGELYQVFGPDKVAQLGPDDRRYVEAQYSWDGIDEPLLGFSLGYLTRIVDQHVENKGIEETVVGGAAAISVRVQQETNSDGVHRTEKATIYLDEAFLPLKMELDIGAGDEYRTTHTFRNEYLARDAVAANFFSFDQLRAIAKTATDNLREAAQQFGRAYWLGDPFEEMVIERVTSGAQDDGEPSLGISYGMANAGAGGPDAPFPCATIYQYTKHGWDDTAARRAQHPDAANRIERDTRSVLTGEARIFELPADRVIQQPHIEGQVPPMPATLAESSRWVAEITLPDAVVELRVDCGPPGKNRYRSLDGVRHLLDALQPFDVR